MLWCTRTVLSTLHHSICLNALLGGFMLTDRILNGAFNAAILGVNTSLQASKVIPLRTAKSGTVHRQFPHKVTKLPCCFGVILALRQL
jgi:hypothetical protein